MIDAHCHIFPPELITNRSTYAEREIWFGELYADPRHHLASAEELVASMDAAQIEASVAIGFAFNDPGLCALCNDYVLDAAARFPERLLPFAVVQPASGEVALREAERCLEHGAFGIGELQPDGQGYSLEEQALLDPLMALLKSREKPVMFHVNEQLGHAYPGKGANGVVAGYALCSRYPENKIILSHWGGGLLFYELMPEVRRTLQNVYYDTAASTLLYDERIFSAAMSWMPNKILWGSDYPLLRQKRFRDYVLNLPLTDDQQQALCGGNVFALLGLSEATP